MESAQRFHQTGCVPGRTSQICWARFAAAFLIIPFLFFAYRALTAQGRVEPLSGVDVPVAVPPIAEAIWSDSSPEAATLRSLIEQPIIASYDLGTLVHALRIFGLGPTNDPQLKSGADIVQALTQSNSLVETEQSTPILFQTRYGVRYWLPTRGSAEFVNGESHRDIVLATLGESRLPLTTPLIAGTTQHELRDVLSDSIAHFHLDQDELEWTAIAYAIYLGPRGHWHNRDGQRYDFNDVTRELLSRPTVEASCGGTHLLYALSIIARVNEQHKILADQVAVLVHDHLSTFVARALGAQSPDGSWDLGWNLDQPPPAFLRTSLTKLHMTGHVLEWLQYVPQQHQPHPEVFERGAKALLDALQAVSQRPIEPGMFCPWTHAFCAVRNLVEDGGNPLVMPRAAGDHPARSAGNFNGGSRVLGHSTLFFSLLWPMPERQYLQGDVFLRERRS